MTVNNKNLSLAVTTERRDVVEKRRVLGHAISCSGSKVQIASVIPKDDVEFSMSWSVGRLVSIAVGESRVVALVSSMRMPDGNWNLEGSNTLNVEAELVGEVRPDLDKVIFSTGISQYPYLGAPVHDIRANDLKLIYDAGSDHAVAVGKLSQNTEMDASICMSSMLSRHFALVGTTGVGKSTALSLLVNKAIDSDDQLRVLVLDPHDEFAPAFGDRSIAIGPETLDLPFWLFKFDEFVEVIFRGQPKVMDEVNVLRDLIGEAKKAFKGNGPSSLSKRNETSSITADSPLPYRMADLLALLDERIGRLEGRNEKPYLRQLKNRVLSAINNPRYSFMFSSNTISDTILETIGTIFRIPGDGKPVTTFQLAGIPSEVVDSVASVLCRMAFEIALWSEGAIKILVVCEEAHRYISSDSKLGFLPTRQAISRIAKEGRKYGVSLGIVTQRPGELDPTILSQCSTVFAMRLANDRDQEIIRSALPNSSTSTTSFLASIGNGEAIAFGEAVAVPMRMKFERVPNYALPSANGVKSTASSLNLRSIVEKMRSTESGKKHPTSPDGFEMGGAGRGTPAPRSDASLRSAMLASEREEIPKEEQKFSSIMKKKSALRRKPITPESGDNKSAADLEREMEEMRNRLLGK
ncbi:MAG: ATP-binding protein [Rhizobiaceae bacterium]|nr:ATP-binding protein [Rhizobiaceae bacterium]